MDAKESIIAGIKQRIIDEHRKHKDLEWEEIAARKIYGSYFPKKPRLVSFSTVIIDYSNIDNNG